MCAFVFGPLGAVPSIYFSDLSISGLAIGAALLQKPIVPPVFAGTHYATINGAMWTISLEFVCYLIVLIAGVLGIVKRGGLWLAFAGVVFSGAVINRFGFFANSPAVYVFSDPLVHLGSFFLVGGSFYVFREQILYSRKLAILAGVVLFGAMFSWRLSEVALLTAGGYLLFYFAFAPIASIARFNKLPDVSYGVYLYGWPVQKLLLWHFPMMSPWVLFVLSFIFALFCGVVSWYAVEKPFLKFKHGYRNGTKTRADRMGAEAG